VRHKLRRRVEERETTSNNRTMERVAGRLPLRRRSRRRTRLLRNHLRIIEQISGTVGQISDIWEPSREIPRKISVKDVPIPFNLSKNDRDRRGFPIPFIVYRDTTGTPHFTIDDVSKLNVVLSKKLCGLCGHPLKVGQMWLVGGPVSVFLDDGMFTAPHAHEECARYAVQVCPFIAAPVYTKLIEAKTLKPGSLDATERIHNDQITPPRPPFFVLARTSSIKLVDSNDNSGKKYILPRRPWKEIEFWHNAKQITRTEAERIAMSSELALRELKWWRT
jgi:hypothetical protein